MRLLITTPDYPPPSGGIQTLVRNLERGLQSLEHEVRLLHIDPTDYDRTWRDFIPQDKARYSVKHVASGEHIYQNAVYRKTTKAIQKFDPDLVHVMHIRQLGALAAANTHGVESILSTYALELEEQELAAKSISLSTVTQTISEFSKKLTAETAKTDSTEIQVIPPSIPVEEYQNCENNDDFDGVGPVVTIARFVDRKNIKTVIAAWKQLKNEGLDRDLIIVGEGPQQDYLQELASGVDTITFTGWVSEERKRKLLSSADLFVLAPRRSNYDVEGFGIVYIEAQASNTPVVGSSNGGAPEAIGDAGLIVDDETNPTAVARAIKSLLTDDELYRECLSAASERINRFSVDSIAWEYTDMYNSILND